MNKGGLASGRQGLVLFTWDPPARCKAPVDTSAARPVSLCVPLWPAIPTDFNERAPRRRRHGRPLCTLRLQELRPELTNVSSWARGHLTGELGPDWVFVRHTVAPGRGP